MHNACYGNIYIYILSSLIDCAMQWIINIRDLSNTEINVEIVSLQNWTHCRAIMYTYINITGIYFVNYCIC